MKLTLQWRKTDNKKNTALDKKFIFLITSYIIYYKILYII